ncbi:sigma-70 family RNA polymerase sigma factor [Roseimaritima ulvae]|nr:sigma-70 family RNA polymerase sigma factor [Roseimaritima ulvae]
MPNRSATSSLRPVWLKMPELEPAIAAWRNSQVRAVPLEGDILRRSASAIASEEIGFIGNRGFGDPDAGQRIFAAPLELQPVQNPPSRPAMRISDLPRHLSRLCEAPLITPDQERLLFERMNFLRHQANQHRSRLDPKRPAKTRIELIRKLLFLADWHRDRIVEANLRLVFSIVKKFTNQHNRFDDLLSDGIVALMRAADKFDFERGFRFSTYATQVVRRDAYRSVVTTRDERQKVSSGLQDMEIDVSDEIRQPNMSESRWHLLRSRLASMLGDLDRREKLIIRARFALGSHRRVQTLQSLASRLGVSKERVRQLERRALDKLTAMAVDAGYQDVEQGMV